MDGLCFNESLLFHMQLLCVWLTRISSSVDCEVDIVLCSRF